MSNATKFWVSIAVTAVLILMYSIALRWPSFNNGERWSFVGLGVYLVAMWCIFDLCLEKPIGSPVTWVRVFNTFLNSLGDKF